MNPQQRLLEASRAYAKAIREQARVAGDARLSAAAHKASEQALTHLAFAANTFANSEVIDVEFEVVVH